MNYKTKINRISNDSRAMLALRIIETVNKSAIEAASQSKLFLQLVGVNKRYQVAIEPGNSKQVKIAIDALYAQREQLFEETYVYLEGLLNSPDPAMKAAATLLFEQVNKYGKNPGNTKVAGQSLRYIRIIEAVKRPEFADALATTKLTERFTLLDQVQLDYEDLYMGRGNNSATRIAPTRMTNEMNNSIKLFMDEVMWMAAREETPEWITLKANLLKRFDEVKVTPRRQPPTTPDDEQSPSN